MTVPRTTIVIVIREAFASTVATIEAVCRHRENDARVLIVDAGSPRSVQREIKRLAEVHDLGLLRVDRYLAPNQARNLGMEHVTTPFAVFVDNDVKVSAGWLDALEECAIDTGAAVVAPTIITDELGHTEVHHTGGEARIVERDGVRILEETMWDHGESTDGVASLSRSVTGEPEFHCVFVDTDWYRRVGGLDEELLSLFEHTDFAMRIREAGGSVWCEPRALVSYGRPRFIKQPDRAYYTLRWS